jgi:hypothetical protein
MELISGETTNLKGKTLIVRGLWSIFDYSKGVPNEIQFFIRFSMRYTIWFLQVSLLERCEKSKRIMRLKDVNVIVTRIDILRTSLKA